MCSLVPPPLFQAFWVFFCLVPARGVPVFIAEIWFKKHTEVDCQTPSTRTGPFFFLLALKRRSGGLELLKQVLHSALRSRHDLSHTHHSGTYSTRGSTVCDASPHSGLALVCASASSASAIHLHSVPPGSRQCLQLQWPCYTCRIRVIARRESDVIAVCPC